MTAVVIAFCASCAATDSEPSTNQVVDIRQDHLEQCPVHHEPLIESVERVDLERGSFHPWYFEVRERLFPCAFDDPAGQGEMAMITYCPTCRVAKAIYLRNDENWPPLLYQVSGETDDEYHDRKKEELDGFISRQQDALNQQQTN